MAGCEGEDLRKGDALPGLVFDPSLTRGDSRHLTDLDVLRYESCWTIGKEKVDDGL